MNPSPPTLRSATWTPAIRVGLSIAAAEKKIADALKSGGFVQPHDCFGWVGANSATSSCNSPGYVRRTWVT